MIRFNTIILLLAISCNYCFTQNVSREIVTNKQVELAFNAYSFLIGQQYIIDKAIKQSPSLKSRISVAENRVNSKFGNCKKNIYDFVTNSAPNYKDLINSLPNKVYGINVDHVDVSALIDDLDNRSNFQIKEPILSTLSYFQFNGNYMREFRNGYTYKYSTKGNEKAKRLDFVLDIPFSWKQRESDRHNVVQKFVPEFDEHSLVAVLMVQEAGVIMDLSASLINESYMNKVFGMNGVILDKYDITIDGCKGCCLKINTENKRLQYNIRTSSVIYMFQYGGKIGYFQVGVSTLKDQHVNIDKYIPICDLIANSIVVNRKWEN
ncbi:hypothetical protein [Parabacteroides bouchesdurhonensis]|uniref:hypothetical protein n=1 Tax=Parabacteroides bouchesdurhonensis TaxID=1936995 RepID=UPI000C85CCEC|nr:hypothetical protein [Parabacteroides bouchesdurhonensis]